MSHAAAAQLQNLHGWPWSSLFAKQFPEHATRWVSVFWLNKMHIQARKCDHMPPSYMLYLNSLVNVIEICEFYPFPFITFMLLIFQLPKINHNYTVYTIITVACYLLYSYLFLIFMHCAQKICGSIYHTAESWKLMYLWVVQCIV